MPTYAVALISLGQTAVGFVSDEILEFYRNFAAMYFGSQARLLNTQPISAVPAPKLYSNISPVLADRLASLQETPDLLILDLANGKSELPPPLPVMEQIIAALSAPPLSKKQPKQVALLLRARLPESDPVTIRLKPWLRRGYAAIVHDDGSIICARESALWANHEPAAYRAAIERARHTGLTRARSRLIRFIGHFQRNSRHAGKDCATYFFDGSACATELAQKIVEDIKALGAGRDGPPTRRIIRSQLGSISWLNGSRPNSAERFTVIEISQPNLGLGVLKVSKPFILLPMCDTAKTAELIVGALISHNAHSTPHILSILSTNGDPASPNQPGLRNIYVSGKAHRVNYLLLVKQARYEQGHCRLCRAGVKFDDPAEVVTRSGGLLPFEFWPMLLGAGMKAEDDVPKSWRIPRAASQLSSDHPIERPTLSLQGQSAFGHPRRRPST